MEGLDRAITVREAARYAKVHQATIHRWISAGFLRVVPKWGKEMGDRVLLSEVWAVVSGTYRDRKRVGHFRCNHGKFWYKKQISGTRFRRLLETADEYERRLKWQREYQRNYNARKMRENA